jgi:hypothetical protein
MIRAMASCEVEFGLYSFEERKQEEWGEEGEVCGGSEGDWINALTASMNEEQEGRGESGGEGNGPWGLAVQKGEGCTGDGDANRQERQMTEGETGGGVGWMLRGEIGVVLPGVDEEAVEAAESREEKR